MIILGGHTYRYVQACKRYVYWVVKGGSEQFWGDFCALSCSCTLAPNYQLGHFSNLNRADKLQNPQLFPPRWWQTPRFCNNVRICGFLSLESFEAGNLHALWHQRLLSNISRPDWKESILKIPRSISHQLVSTLGLASGLPTIHIDSTMELCSGRRLNIGMKVWRMRPRQRRRL